MLVLIGAGVLAEREPELGQLLSHAEHGRAVRSPYAPIMGGREYGERPDSGRADDDAERPPPLSSPLTHFPARITCSRARPGHGGLRSLGAP
ncbi:hypothetical protein GCM10010331_68990 [Streptomyces xanthochromogenes]|nr:hypothetical protein GCM10010331_68990 [Streptomyces xanthochromogenes]